MKLASRRRIVASLGVLVLCAAGCGDPAARAPQTPAPADILLFVGGGTSPSDVAAVESILRGGRFSYSTASSSQLNALSESWLRAYRLLIVPGGNFEEIGNNLSSSTTANIRRAVRGGLNYLGLCAGAFFAGHSPYNGLNLTDGVRFSFYALEYQDIRKGVVTITFADTSTSDQYWEDGPQLSGWGEAVATYPDGTPAIVEGEVGDGWVILTGIHPEAPESWRRGLTFRTPVSENNAYAASLIEAALHGVRLQHY